MAFEIVPLGAVANITKLAGFEFTKYISYDDAGEIIALRALNLRNGELDLSDVKRIKRSVSESLERSKLYINDILLTYTGNGYGDCAIITENDKYHLAPNICKISPLPGLIHPYFLYSYIRSKSFYTQMSNHMVGSSQPTIPMKTIRVLEVPLPSFETQERIVAIIHSLDEKVRLNQRINDNLERQAQAVFTDWFIEFTPFANEEFVMSPTGIEIQKSLQMKQIINIPHILETGRRPKGGATFSGMPSVGAENVKRLGQFDFSSNKYIPEDFAAKQKTGRITGYELLLYKDGGKPGTFIPHFSMFGEGFPYKEFFINEHVFKLDFFDRGKNEFCYYRNILYVVIVFVLWGYLIYNWEKCISMQFFNQFDGNNILFLIGIALLILPFFRFEIEGKGVKVQAEMRKEMQADFQNADSDYKIKLIQRLISSDSENRKGDN